MKTKLQSWGFTLGHLQLIGIAVAIFGVLIFSQSHISLHAMFSKASDNKMLTYDDAKAQVMAESGIADSSANDQSTEDQFALLNVQDDNGKVLGDEVGLSDVPEASQVFTPEVLSQITLKTTASTDPKTIFDYANQVSNIELNNDAIQILSDINSDDPQTVTKAKAQAVKSLQAFGSITVPEPFVEYHRYKMMYYTILSNLGDIWLGNRPQTDLQSQTKALMSVMNKIDQLESDLNQKFSTDL